MKFRTSLLLLVICYISSYVSLSEASFASTTRKKSLAEQLKVFREAERAQRQAVFGQMSSGIKLSTIQEEPSPDMNKSVNQQKSQSVNTSKPTYTKEQFSFVPLYKGVNHPLSFSGKKPISLLGRVLPMIPLQSDEEGSVSKLCVIASD